MSSKVNSTSSRVDGRLPRFALIGRPNVGKSTLFNILTNTRKAVVRNQPGVTRDIQIEHAEWCGFEFDVMDTGGLTEANDVFSKLIQQQVRVAVEDVDALILIMDGRAGLLPEDREIFILASQLKKPFLIVVNKIDQPHQAEMLTSEFYEFGEDVLACSFERRRGIDEILEWILEKAPATVEVEVDRPVTIAILGKPNVGKSSMVNHLLGIERMIVSDIAGTTVDAIDSELTFDDKKYRLIDTAGLRRSARRKDGVEALAAFKSRDSVDRADIVLLMVDAMEGPTDQDAKIAEMVMERHKGLIMVANKLDIGESERDEFRKTFRAQVAEQFHFFTDIPIVFTSAKTGAGIKKMFETIDDLWKKLNVRIPTSQLNNFFFDTIRKAPAPVDKQKDVKFYYLTQTQQVPPSFIAFANLPDGVSPSYRRFLVRNIKEKWDLQGVPIRIFAMKSKGKRESSRA